MKLRAPGSNNKKFIGTVISLAFTLLVVWIFVMATMNNDNSTTSLNAADQMRLDSLRTVLGRSGAAIHSSANPNLFYNALPAFLFLLLLLGGVWLWNRRREKPGNQQLFSVVGEQQLAPGQTIKIIAFQNEYWVIGVAGNNMTLLSRLNKDEWSPPDPKDLSSISNSFSNIFSGIQKMRS